VGLKTAVQISQSGTAAACEMLAYKRASNFSE